MVKDKAVSLANNIFNLTDFNPNNFTLNLLILPLILDFLSSFL